MRPAVFGRMVDWYGAGCHLVGTSGRRTLNSAASGKAGGISEALSVDVRLTNRAGACSRSSDRRRTWNVSLPAWARLLNVAMRLCLPSLRAPLENGFNIHMQEAAGGLGVTGCPLLGVKRTKASARLTSLLSQNRSSPITIFLLQVLQHLPFRSLLFQFLCFLVCKARFHLFIGLWPVEMDLHIQPIIPG